MAWRRLRLLSMAGALALTALQLAPSVTAQVVTPSTPAPPTGTAKLLDGLRNLVAVPITTADQNRRAAMPAKRKRRHSNG